MKHVQSDLPDMSALALGHCALVLVRTYQVNNSCPCYIYSMYHHKINTTPVHNNIIS